MSLSLLFSSTALAYGPGIHCREADRALEMIIELDDSWANDMEGPYARSYLRMGANSPDFQWAADGLNFGHSKELSYHLLQSAQSLGPEHRLFALGHLAHVAGDASAEVFVTPTLFASAPIGPMDLFVGDDNAKAESEAILEGYGDLVNGDWLAVVECIWDLRLESPEAWQRFEDVFLWYCEAGNELYDNSDCALALENLDQSFGVADDLLGSSDLEGAKALISLLIDQPLEALFDLYSSGLLSFLLGQEAAESENFDFYSNHFLTGPLVDPKLWTIYDKHFQDLGPAFTRDHYEHEITGWPEYDGVSIISGNIQSLLQFLPQYYSAQPGLHVTDLRWFNAEGEQVSDISMADAGKSMTAEVRLFSALPFAGTVYGHVLRDMPGLTPDLDEWVGEGEVSMDIDPLNYSLTPQTFLTIPFTVDADGVNGFYVELFVGEDEKPWFSTSSDRLWEIQELPMNLPVYHHFDTYQDYPNSLKVADAENNQGSLLLHINVAPNGPGIAGASATILEETTSTNDTGNATFPTLEPVFYDGSASAEGYSTETKSIPVATGAPSWNSIALHGLPSPALPQWVPSNTCIPVTWNTEVFADQAVDFNARATSPDQSDEWISTRSMGIEGKGELCADAPLENGLELIVALVAVYGDGTEGIQEWTEPVRLDGSEPDFQEMIQTLVPLNCAELSEDTFPGFTLSIQVRDLESGIAKATYSMGGEDDWQEIEFEAQDDEKWTVISFSKDSKTATQETEGLSLRIYNNAGGITEIPLNPMEAISPCSEKEGEEGAENQESTENEEGKESPSEESNESATDEDSESEEQNSGAADASSGCAATRVPSPLPPLFLFIGILFFRKRTRKTHFQG